jgi:uncharacterized membrane protein YuzA (DUF378 family)
VSRVVYSLVGLAAVYAIASLVTTARRPVAHPRSPMTAEGH